MLPSYLANSPASENNQETNVEFNEQHSLKRKKEEIDKELKAWEIFDEVNKYKDEPSFKKAKKALNQTECCPAGRNLIDNVFMQDCESSDNDSSSDDDQSNGAYKKSCLGLYKSAIPSKASCIMDTSEELPSIIIPARRRRKSANTNSPTSPTIPSNVTNEQVTTLANVSSARSAKKWNSFEMMPHGILVFIMSYISQPMIIHAMMAVCKRWYQISKFSTLWKRIDFNGSFKIKSMSDVVGFLEDFTTLKISDMRKTYALGSTVLMESLGGLGQKEVIYNVQQYEYGLSLQKQEQLGIYKNGGVLLPPKKSRMPHLFGEIILPASCSNLSVETFEKLKEVYPSLSKLVLPMCSTISTVSNTGAFPINADNNSRIQFNTEDIENSISDSVLLQIAKMPYLSYLKVSTHHKLTDQGLNEFSILSKRLESIELDYCLGLTQQSLLHLVKNSKHINTISALSNGNIVLGDQELVELSQYGSHLKELRIDVSNISLPSFATFIKGCRRLQTLFIRGLDCITDKTLDVIFAELRYIRNITIICESPEKTATNKIFSTTISSTTLESFQITGCETLNISFDHCTNLKKVSIDQCKSLTGLQISNSLLVDELKFRSSNIAYVNLSQLINSLPKLREFELFDCQSGETNKTVTFNSDIMRKIIILMCNDIINLEVLCSNLRSMSVDLCANIEKLILKSPKLENLQMFALPQSATPKLKHLFVESDHIQSLNLQKILSLEQIAVKCKSLDSLNVSNLHQLRRLETGPCPKLEKLALGSVFLLFDDHLVSNIISKCPNISMLSISNSVSLNDVSLGVLCNNLPNLQALVISNCQRLWNVNIQSSVLKGIQISDCHLLKYLNLKSENLNKLFIRNCPNVEDSTFDNLSAFSPNIKFVELVNCSMLKSPHLKLPQLVDLHFRECAQLEVPTITSEYLKKLLIVSCTKFSHFNAQSATLSEILLSECPNLNEANLTKSLSQTENIQAIVFDKCKALRAPQLNLDNLKLVRFTSCNNLVNPKINIRGNLSVLSFQHCDNIKIEKLSTNITGQNIDNIEITECKGMTKLSCDLPTKSLSVSGCSKLSSLTLSQTIQTILVEKCQALCTIQCPQECRVTELKVKDCEQFSSVQFSGPNQDMKILGFSRCPRLSDMCLASMLSKCQTLEKARLSACGLARPFINHANLSTLHISHCQYLERMRLKCPKLITLKLNDCQALNSVVFAEASPELKNVTLKGLSVCASDRELLMRCSNSSVASQ
ncbi:predicted protein [Naegleria gruberi]|uniref:Predicted protein n=1 Tax=Naegleria gruberi TaxID=5762 RepID=D2VI59_NAEGR|nr:uncharacterized protein NAEGRDRAFT_80052 [Naegleria gruberi]EFC43458.1 predicted protein [Naegleria gruberi]|eukprot:XP_002676202.1 predicted protein [Naegleria gruberi strain NEG-M]